MHEVEFGRYLPMTLIALIHAVWLSLLPIGIIVAIGVGVRRRRLGIVVGGILVAVSLPAIAFCTMMWPLDFLLPRTEMRVLVVAQTYSVTLVQRPGVDFYDSFFEVCRSDGKIARVMIDADDSKWWRPRVIVQGTRSYFVRWPEGITPQTSFVDAADGTLFSGHYGRTHKLEDINYEKPWANW